MMTKYITIRFFSCLCLLFLLLCSSAELLARDPQNCLFCHKYRRLRVYDDKGTLHNYYVDTGQFHQSIHRSVTCIGCHSDISKVPHGEIERVDCAKVCHLDRFTVMAGENFSHSEVAHNLQQSVHGVKPDDPPEIAALKPDCKYCHLNDLYTQPDELPTDAVLRRCLNCHKEEGLQEVFTHISHRFKLKTSRPPLEIVQLCSCCHADRDFHTVMGFTGPKATKLLRPTRRLSTIGFCNSEEKIPPPVTAVMPLKAFMIYGLPPIPSLQSILTIATKPARQVSVTKVPAP